MVVDGITVTEEEADEAWRYKLLRQRDLAFGDFLFETKEDSIRIYRQMTGKSDERPNKVTE